MAALVMSDSATYSAVELLRHGQPVEIRALRPDDRANLLAAVGRTSSQSLYRRFFAVKRGFMERENRLLLERRLRQPRGLGRRAGGRRATVDRRRRPLHRRAAWAGRSWFTLC